MSAPDGWKPLSLGGFADHFGPVLARREGPDAWSYALVAGDIHLNPAGRVHGGVLTTLADQAMSLVAWEAAGRQNVVTVQFSASFVGAAGAGDLLTAEARVERRTGSLMFVGARILTPRGPALLASGVWKPVRERQEETDR